MMSSVILIVQSGGKLLVRPVVTKMDPMNGTGTMHYEWIVRESVRTTKMVTADNYLEVPVLKLPRRFLHLAAEARTVEIMNDNLCCLSDVQPQGIGLPKPVLVTVMMDSPVRQCKLINRVDRGVSPDTTEQPLLLGLNTDERETAPTDMGGSDVNSAKNSECGPLNMTEQPASPRAADGRDGKYSRVPRGLHDVFGWTG